MTDRTPFSGESEIDTAVFALKGKVVHEIYDWENVVSPRIPTAQTVLYELHPKGFTKLHPDVPENIRGTYAALAEPAVLDYLEKLGVTTVELLPVFSKTNEARLTRMGLVNYWGYNTDRVSLHPKMPTGQDGRVRPPMSELKDAIKALHRRRIEVILDVVYNHTAEGDERGPTLSYRGIDNAMYYHLLSDDPARYENWSGCGDCPGSGPSPGFADGDGFTPVLGGGAFHIDGFRADLAPILARDHTGSWINSGFFRAVAEDPVLTPRKTDCRALGYGAGRLPAGQFSVGWLEWNDKYRDVMRSFWLHQGPSLGEFVRRFAGSADLFRHKERQPISSVNFITAHDGFTLMDLVSYNHKHNEANGENNRDGTDHNLSWNCGQEGEATLSEVILRRKKLRRALLATLLFSQGTPMLVAGDEFGHSQQGNNNPYCHDSELTWLDWEKADTPLQEFVASLIALRKRYPALRQSKWFTEDNMTFDNTDAVIRWLSPTGSEKMGSAWTDKSLFCMGMLIRTNNPPNTCLILLNASLHSIIFRLPPGRWKVQADSSDTFEVKSNLEFQVLLPGNSILLAVP